ncbi:MAG TPA: hypothetical protein VMH82_18595 [Myxococcota bacterium]|nr:hypothetical protein [Myxococcota bacterium]
MRIRDRLGPLTVALLSFASATSARALPPECPLLFPDFRCDRHGRYEGFVPPMTNPFLFEDPFITTGISAWGLWHQFPNSSILEGGHLWGAAAQARVAITDRIAFIATKDGWIDFDPRLDLMNHSQGFANLGFGLKGALIDRPDIPFILTPSLRVEVPTGSADVLQGMDGSVLIPGLSAAWGYDRFHAIGMVGGQVPIDTNAKSTSFIYYLHLDYAVHPHIVPFVELAGYHYTDGGNGESEVRLAHGQHVEVGTAFSLLGIPGQEGYDYTNLGSPGVAGNNIIVGALGLRVPVNRHVILGASWEHVLTNREDVIRQRATMNVTFEF